MQNIDTYHMLIQAIHIGDGFTRTIEEGYRIFKYFRPTDKGIYSYLYFTHFRGSIYAICSDECAAFNALPHEVIKTLMSSTDDLK